MKPLVIAAAVLGLVFIILAGFYFVTPAAALPRFFPGYNPAGAAIHHYKHGLGALIVALALFAFAWFQSKPAKAG